MQGIITVRLELLSGDISKSMNLRTLHFLLLFIIHGSLSRSASYFNIFLKFLLSAWINPFSMAVDTASSCRMKQT